VAIASLDLHPEVIHGHALQVFQQSDI